ncbi:MAG TPA: VOC family protein [Chthoniobacterales bacterium]|nr:VOC family protein [Chthoniobacterales bacterium]
MTRPPRIFESVLYADDLAAAERFYRDVLKLEVITRSELVVSFRCAHGVLLIFNPKLSSPPGRDVPSHGRSGSGHLAFVATDAEREEWKRRLMSAGVAIEAEIDWEQRGRSLYFRDPAGNSIEFAPLTLWGGGW